ncbi:TIR domain-containing protein [Nodosilinea sp. PGN35]|uniref:TIR domain-containing protein n=1 Tax=Nodosilinea sp. PGN35 TaxID=3020489 RepID=UPI0023B29AE0|nr:TIR domain-containing protein [Nodosilinea sp. TSF1-S3]MDF0368499.1 TIR domain-containing protein [Nodosilinea sp. TSF1-S3]
MLTPNAIFISYRRSDSNDAAGRIYDRLTAHFGKASIFKDVHSIPYGVDFSAYIQQEVAQCRVLLAVIGPTWLTTERDGQRRLADPQDWVRLEIQTALENPQMTVIPLLVGNARPPAQTDLPDGLRALATLNSAQARPDPDFHGDLTRLVRRLEELVSSGKSGETTATASMGKTAHMPISISERLTLIQTLNGLPMAQFEELAIALDPPPGILPPNIAAQGNRAPALLQWVEGPTGPGLTVLCDLLNLYLQPEGQAGAQRSGAEPTPAGGNPLSASRKGFYERQKAQLEAELAAVESDLESAPRQVDRLRLEKAAERLLEKIDDLNTRLQD